MSVPEREKECMWIVSPSGVEVQYLVKDRNSPFFLFLFFICSQLGKSVPEGGCQRWGLSCRLMVPPPSRPLALMLVLPLSSGCGAVTVGEYLQCWSSPLLPPSLPPCLLLLARSLSLLCSYPRHLLSSLTILAFQFLFFPSSCLLFSTSPSTLHLTHVHFLSLHLPSLLACFLPISWGIRKDKHTPPPPLVSHSQCWEKTTGDQQGSHWSPASTAPKIRERSRD